MSIPVLTIDQMREWEKATWASGCTESEVIQRVGKAVALLATRLAKPGDRILIFAGKGHNGDDARLAQSHLHNRHVIVINVSDPRQALTEFETQLNNFHAQGVGHNILVIDGLFGIGLNRPLNEDWRALINGINNAKIPVLAVDVPSGLNAQTGNIEGAAIRAAVTLAVGAPKRGMLNATAWDFVGRMEVASDVGLIPCPVASDLEWITPADFNAFPAQRPIAGHKGSFGHLTIIAGSVGYHGAAVLATRGALRAQPGLVTVITQENVYVPIASQMQAAMVHPWHPGQKVPDSTTAILVGPGLAAEGLSPILKNELRAFWNESPLPVVADASALDWLPPGPVPKNPLRVITPHPGEAARLLKSTSQNVQNNRPAALRELSKRYGNCWVVLKGHQTLIGRSTGAIAVNSSGNPFLAQGGSGDVLAGFIAGHLAQPALQADAEKTIRFAVWNHGATAEKLSSERNNWTVEDLVQRLGEI